MEGSLNKSQGVRRRRPGGQSLLAALVFGAHTLEHNYVQAVLFLDSIGNTIRASSFVLVSNSTDYQRIAVERICQQRSPNFSIFLIAQVKMLRSLRRVQLDFQRKVREKRSLELAFVKNPDAYSIIGDLNNQVPDEVTCGMRFATFSALFKMPQSQSCSARLLHRRI